MSWNRIARLEGLIKEKVALILLRRLNDPRLGFVTITKAELSRDKSQCRVFYSVLGDAGERSKAQHALEAAQGHIQRHLGKTLRTRFTPRLSFVFDESIEGVIRLGETLKELAREQVAGPDGATRESDGEPIAGDDADDAAGETAEDAPPGSLS